MPAPAPARTKLLADEEAESASKLKASRKGVRRTVVQQVQKKYWDHFRDFSDYQRYILTWENLTLDARIRRDTDKVNEGGGPTMGAIYYRQLRSHYSVQSASATALVSSNTAEEVRPALRAAYKLYKSRPKQRGPLLEVLKSLQYQNNKEVVGLAKAVLEEDATKTTEQAECIMGLAKWFAVNHIPVKEPAVFSAVKHHFDINLTAVFREIKKEGVTLTAFCDVHKAIIMMFVPEADLDQLLTAEGSWDKYETQLNMVVASSLIGEAMWSWAQAKVVQSKIATMMTRFSTTLLNTADLTVGVASELCTVVRLEWSSIRGIDRLPLRRDVEIEYRGLSCQHNVNGLEDELQRRVQAEARGRASQAKLVTALMFEEALVGNELLANTSVDLAIVAGCNVSRTAANEFCSREHTSPNGTEFLQIMKARQ